MTHSANHHLSKVFLSIASSRNKSEPTDVETFSGTPRFISWRFDLRSKFYVQLPEYFNCILFSVWSVYLCSRYWLDLIIGYLFKYRLRSALFLAFRKLRQGVIAYPLFTQSFGLPYLALLVGLKKIYPSACSPYQMGGGKSNPKDLLWIL